MKKTYALVMLLAIALLATAFPVQAQGIVDVYVDTAYTGSESGTQAQPYNTLQEGRAFAQAQPNGGWLYVKQADGSWQRQQYIPPARPGISGAPLTDAMLYGLMAVLALVLILVGWQFQRRSRLLRA